MASLQQILSWFKAGLFPNEDQFRQTWLSYWHKSEKLPLTQILELNDALNSKATKEDLQSVIVGLRPMGSVKTVEELKLIKNPNDNDSYFVTETKDENGDPYIWRYDAIINEWINTNQVVYQDVARKGGYSGTLNDLDDATKLAQESINITEVSKFIYSITDSEKHVLFGIYADGSIYEPITDKLTLADTVKEIINSERPISASAIQKTLDPQSISKHIYSLVDSGNNLLEYIDQKGFKHYAKQQLMEKVTTNQFLFSVVDQENNILEYTDRNGLKHYPNQQLMDKANFNQFLFSIVDENNNVLEYTDHKGIKHYAKQQLIDKVNVSQYPFSILDNDGKVLAAIKQNGDLVASIPEINDLKGLKEEIENMLSGYRGNRSIISWGDSLTAGAGGNGTTYSTVLQALLGNDYNIVNCGVGGETAATISARQGGMPAYIKQGFVLPQNTDWVTISENTTTGNTFTNKFGKLISPLLQGAGNSVNPCFIQGVECTLNYDTSTQSWRIRRNVTTKQETIIPINSPIFFYGSKAYRNPFAQIIWIGQNSGGHSSNEQLIKYYLSMIDFSGCQNYVTIGLHTGTASSRAELEKDMFETFGQRYINWREYISSLEAFYDAGLTPTQSDLEAISEGSLPPAFWSTQTDKVHLNGAGYTLLGQLIYKRFQLLGII